MEYETPTAEEQARFIESLMPDRCCCPAFRAALQRTILTLSSDGLYYIAGREGNAVIFRCPWCGHELVTDGEKGRLLKEWE